MALACSLRTSVLGQRLSLLDAVSGSGRERNSTVRLLSTKTALQSWTSFHGDLKCLQAPATCLPAGSIPRRSCTVRAQAAATSAVTPDPLAEGLEKLRGTSAPPLSDMFWTAMGTFLAMAGFAWFDHLLAPRGLSMTIGSFGAVCVLLFAAPKSPVSQKWNVVMGHIGCALCSIVALSIFGPGWLARGVALTASVVYMQFTNCIHPPAAGLPLIFIDGPKFQHLKWWYVLFPGLLGCAYLFLLQEVVLYMKDTFKF
eukprot:jgi/Mesen1/2784/ME000170S01891